MILRRFLRSRRTRSADSTMGAANSISSGGSFHARDWATKHVKRDNFSDIFPVEDWAERQAKFAATAGTVQFFPAEHVPAEEEQSLWPPSSALGLRSLLRLSQAKVGADVDADVVREQVGGGEQFRAEKEEGCRAGQEEGFGARQEHVFHTGKEEGVRAGKHFRAWDQFLAREEMRQGAEAQGGEEFWRDKSVETVKGDEEEEELRPLGAARVRFAAEVRVYFFEDTDRGEGYCGDGGFGGLGVPEAVQELMRGRESDGGGGRGLGGGRLGKGGLGDVRDSIDVGRGRVGGWGRPTAFIDEFNDEFGLTDESGEDGDEWAGYSAREDSSYSSFGSAEEMLVVRGAAPEGGFPREAHGSFEDAQEKVNGEKASTLPRSTSLPSCRVSSFFSRWDRGIGERRASSIFERLERDNRDDSDQANDFFHDSEKSRRSFGRSGKRADFKAKMRSSTGSLPRMSPGGDGKERRRSFARTGSFMGLGGSGRSGRGVSGPIAALLQRRAVGKRHDGSDLLAEDRANGITYDDVGAVHVGKAVSEQKNDT